jgi:hypothetical protein
MIYQDLRGRLNHLLIKRIHECEYPSRALMDRIEEMLSDHEQATVYAHVLIHKIGRTRYPSLQLLDRLTALISRIEDDC